MISLTNKPVLILKRWKNESATLLFFFWLLLRLPKSSISGGSVQNDNLLLAPTVIDWIDLAFLWNSYWEWEWDWEVEQIAGTAEEEDKVHVDAKAASMEAISSSLKGTEAVEEDREELAEAKAASRAAISSSLTYSIGMSTPLLLL